ncbi:beta-2 adrenergic receptor-like [Stylophora pistillata]|uniref:beta-2 adrenergic receptor-like n=1 Tax=Stylophora pistillata TaxID=50429 RepID=UPI000C047676|nr:beta-2 adrenergic receptor-like [Stylophora pistillata]XP_022792301.1 beta-2 adrenergic receptor-like [Stylophora pistillata]XP_022792302.1 beta-2 adrenergic receptor-like [Stylophora pistillata]
MVGNTSTNGTEPENEFKFLTSPLIVLMSFMCLLIVFENGLIIFLMCRKRILRTLTNMFLTSLALSDLTSGLVRMPLFFICSLDTHSLHVCVASTVFTRLTAISSVCHVLLIAADRYVFIVHDMKYRVFVTKRRAMAATLAVWLISILASVVQLSWYIFHGIEFSDRPAFIYDLNKQYALACIVLFFAGPFLLIFYIYGRIFYISYELNKNDRKRIKTYNYKLPTGSLRHEWRGRSILLITMIIFGGCWLPYFFTVLHDHSSSSDDSTIPLWSQRLQTCLGFLPMMLNPILCTLAKKDFRHAFKEIVIGRRSSRHFNQDISLQTTRERFRTIDSESERT